MQQLITRIKKIENEQRRRSQHPLKRYNAGAKVHAKQMAFHKCQLRNRWVFGGNRSGKTECGAVETVWLARGIHPFRPNRKDVNCWVVSLSQNVQREVAQQKVLYYLDRSWIKQIVMAQGKQGAPQHGVIDYLLIENVFGGTSKIAFKSCEQGREKFQGASLDFVWFDEEPPFDVYQECRMRVLDRCGEIFGTMTPLKGLTWVYDEIFCNRSGSSETWCTFMEWGDNPFLDKKEVALMTSTLSSDELESRRYGHFRSSSGLVYGEFDENVHVIAPFQVPTEWMDKLSIDPGLNNPLSCHWYAVDDDGNVYVVAEHYQAGKEVAFHAEKIKQISQKLGWPTDKFGNLVALMDSAGNQKTLSGTQSVAELFRQQGIAVSTQVNKDVTYGINVVKSYLKTANGTTKLYVFKTCSHLIQEIKGYFWGENDRPVKRNDHAMDELRYYLCSVANQPRKVVQKSFIQKDKERLYRQLQRRGPL